MPRGEKPRMIMSAGSVSKLNSIMSAPPGNADGNLLASLGSVLKLSANLSQSEQLTQIMKGLPTLVELAKQGKLTEQQLKQVGSASCIQIRMDSDCFVF